MSGERGAGRMRVLRRVGLYGVLPLVVVALAAFGWYRFSDTGRDMRYRDRLADFCQGLLPEAESAALTGRAESAFGAEGQHTDADGVRWESCGLADLHLTIGRVDPAAGNHGRAGAFFTRLNLGSGGRLPMALGGGWSGYTDLTNTAAVLTCTNRDASVLVSATTDSREPTTADARRVARLVTATSVRAARHYGCAAAHGTGAPAVPDPEDEIPVGPDAGAATEAGADAPGRTVRTCDGIPVRTAVDTGEVNWTKETKAAGSPPVEECMLGKTAGVNEAAYLYQADFGPFAQRLRSAPSGGGNGSAAASGGYGFPADADSGRGHAGAWATARCPGTSVRAVFTVTATEYASPKKAFLDASLRAFAERAARRHGCTDLRLPR